jgi:2-(1,2-epoxy-1,2-dihydrophenyl)acetyl-CoA isomerase
MTAPQREPGPGPDRGDRRVELQIGPDGVAHLRLTRPPHTAIDRPLTTQLGAAVADLASDGHARSVLITAEGPNLSVGGDLVALAAAGDRVGELLDGMITEYHRALTTLAELPLPVVCALKGVAAGGGLGLLWAADVVVAADDARLVLAFAALGLSGDGGSSWYLPRLVGLRRALELVIDGRTLPAGEALALGLVTRVVPAADVDREAAQVATRLAAGPTRALGAIRRLYRDAFDRDLASQLAAEQQLVTELAASADGREGVRAFTEHRRPGWEGR